MSDEIKDIPKEKPVAKEKPVKVVEPASGKVAFIRDGVTIIRDISYKNELAASGWARK